MESLHLSRVAVGMVLSGKKRLYHADKATTITTSEIFILGNGIHYEENIPENGSFEQVLFYLSPQDIQSAFISLSSAVNITAFSKHKCTRCRQFNALTAPAHNMFSLFFQSVRRLFDEESYCQIEAIQHMKLNELVLLIMTFADDCMKAMLIKGADATNVAFTSKIYENIFSDASISRLAELTNRSLTSFKKEFVRTFNASPHQWLINQRLNRAKQLLGTSSMNISEIGNDCGFSNISHFIKLFKQRFNTTPAAMRKELIQKEGAR